MKLNLLQSIKSIGRLKLLTGVLLISVLLVGAVLAVHLLPLSDFRSNPVPIVSLKEDASKSGEVAGVSTNNLTSTPSPTPVKSKRNPSPTLRPTATNNTNQSASNNQPNNNTSSNSNNSQPDQSNNTSQSNPTPTPTEPINDNPSPTPTPIPTSQPTLDIRPFEVTFTPTVNGSSFSFTAAANKPIKQCEWDWYNPSSGSGIGGTSNGSDLTCGANANKEGSSKYYVRVISMSDDVKEFGEKKPCTGNVCN